jgi:hypothetical protein
MDDFEGAENDVVLEMLRYARPGITLESTRERDAVRRLCEVSKAFLTRRACELIATHANGRPLVRFYSSDGNPMLVNKMFIKILHGNRRIVRYGRHGTEFFNQRCFYRGYDEQGHAMQTVTFTEPISLTDGKKGWNLFACQRDVGPLPRDLGYVGPLLHHYVWDRGCYSILDRITRQFHCHENSKNARPTAPLENLLCFVFTRADVLHDAQNGAGWGVKEYSSDEVLKNLFVGISAVRNSYAELMKYLPLWLPTVVVFRNHSFTDATLVQLWQALDVDVFAAEVMVKHRVLYIDGALLVDVDSEFDPDLFVDLVGAMMGVWRFTTFSDSRFATISRSSKALLGAELSGMSSLIRYCRNTMHVSEFYIHGYDRLDTPTRNLVSITSLSCGCADSIITSLMEDDRVCMKVDEIEDTMVTELDYLFQLPDAVFAILSVLTAYRAQELRSRILAAALTSASFISFKILREARELPWSLCLGDAEANLRELSSNPQPLETNSAQLWTLMEKNYPMKGLIDIVEEIKGLPWSSLGVEQQHAATAQFKRMHPSTQEEMLRCRAMAYMMRPLLARDEVVKRVGRLQMHIQLLKRKVPNRLSGKCLFLRDVFSQWKDLSGSVVVPSEIRVGILASHGGEYFDLPSAVRRAYEERAASERLETIADLCDDVLHMETEIDLLRERALAEPCVSTPWVLSACTFTEEEKAHFDSLYRGGSFSNKKVRELREVCATAPEIPDVFCRLALSRIELPTAPAPPLPPWLGEVCAQREHFARTALVWQGETDDAEPEFFFFCFAYQNPRLLSLMSLSREAFASSLASDGGYGVQGLDAHWDYAFRVQCAFLYSSDNLSHWLEDRLGVLESIVFLEGRRCVSHASIQGLRTFLDKLPPPKRNVGAGGSRGVHGGAAPRSKLVADNPWTLAYIDEGLQFLKKHKKNSGPGHNDSSDDDEASDEADEGELFPIADVYAAMEAAGRDVADDNTGSFKVAPVGGQWTASHLGVAQDAWRGIAVGHAAQDWCTRYGLQATMRFDVALYEHSGALTCARYWVAKHDYWFQAWLLDGMLVPYLYSDEVLNGFEEPLAFTTLCTTIVAGRAQARFAALRFLVPTGQGA